MPPALVDAYDKQAHYTPEEVKDTFGQEFKYEHNIEYAFAMFCAEQAFDELNLNSTYSDLRTDISKKCFGSWPRFNFESLLDYSRCSSLMHGGDGFLGGDGGCGDCGGD